jgi:signal transduction histidine kinase/DNA-binding response OmpR family regulator
MNDESINVLMIEDNPAEISWMQEMFIEATGASFKLVHSARRLSEGMEWLAQGDIDVVLLDLMLPDSEGLSTFDQVRAEAPRVPIIVLSGMDDESLALKAVRKGAQDYLVKGQVSSGLLSRSIRYAIERNRTEEALKRRAAQLALLNDISGRIVSVLDWESVLERAVTMVQETFGYYNVAILTLEEERDELIVRASTGILSDIFLSNPRVELGEGMVGWVGLHCETLLANDVCEASQYMNPAPDMIETRSELSVPIRMGGKVAGVIDLQSPELDAFDDNDVMVVETLADQIAVAIENARLYQAARQVDRLQVLSDLDQAMATTLDPDEVAEITLQQIATALDVSMGVLLILSPQAGIDPTQVFVLEQGWVDMTFEKEDQSSLQNFMQRWDGQQEVVSLSGAELLDICAEGHVNVAGDWGEHGLLAPIWGEREVVAVLVLGGRPSQHPFTNEDRMLVQMAVSRAGQAMQNAQLYQASRDNSERLATLNAISAAAVSSLDLDKILQQVLEMTCQALDAVEGSILLHEPDVDELLFAMTSAEDGNELRGKRIPLDHGIAGWVMKHGEAIYVSDVSQDPRWYDGVDDLTGFETKSLACAPLEHQGEIDGVIEVVNKRDGEFTAEDLSLLEAVASIAASAMENALLYDEQRELLREREETQAQLIHAEKMSALGRLAASIAHEINNPLQAVQGCLTLVDEEIHADGREEKLNRYLGIAESEIERVSGIVRHMRDFYRQSGKGFRPTEVQSVLDSVLTLSHKQLQHADVVVERDWEDDLPMIQANPDHLKQVFLNLVINAIDAMPEGGVLHLRTRLDRMKPHSGGRSVPAVSVEFSDTGIGMSAEVQEHLFEPFFTTKEEGSGLGLSISYGIIQSHEGRIEVESQEGEGTTFVIQLPVYF